MKEPQDWLNAPQGPTGPLLPGFMFERLRTGDVTADGDLLQEDGTRLIGGSMLVTPQQAHAAAYYGWALSGVSLVRDGRYVTQIFRKSAKCI